MYVNSIKPYCTYKYLITEKVQKLLLLCHKTIHKKKKLYFPPKTMFATSSLTHNGKGKLAEGILLAYAFSTYSVI